MKSSNFVAAESLMKLIVQTTNQLARLQQCTAVSFTENNHMEGQIRLQFACSDAVGSKIIEACAAVLLQRKQTYIKELQDKYDVTYDGD